MLKQPNGFLLGDLWLICGHGLVNVMACTQSSRGTGCWPQRKLNNMRVEEGMHPPQTIPMILNGRSCEIAKFLQRSECFGGILLMIIFLAGPISNGGTLTRLIFAKLGELVLRRPSMHCLSVHMQECFGASYVSYLVSGSQTCTLIHGLQCCWRMELARRWTVQSYYVGHGPFGSREMTVYTASPPLR
jgi:hypothetical protein